jgi:phospholipase C
MPWTITISQSGSFAPSGTGQYSITGTNSTASGTSGTVTVTDSLPSGGIFTATSLGGTGWTCTLSAVSCSRSDALAAGASYPAITLGVSVSATASGTVTDQATISGGGPTNATASIQTPIGASGNGKIQHVVVIFQENRTPDNLFHDPVLMNRTPCPGACADIASVGQSTNGPVTLTAVPLVTNYDLGHGHDSFLDSCDWNGIACAMDGANTDGCSPSGNCPANPQYQYVQASDVQPYFTMAETYTFGDQMFQTNQGPSFPAHQYIISGSSAVCMPGGSCPGGTTSTVYVAGNPSNSERADGTPGAGCLAPPGASVNLIDTSQPFPNSNLTTLDGQECFEHPTLTDLLETAKLSWTYYSVSDGSIWTGPDAIQHICRPSGPQDQLACSGTDWSDHVVIEGTGAQILTDIQNCQLPNVTWVIPDGAASDHASINTGLGPSWVASIVNAIGTNPACPSTNEIYWNDTAIIVTWDDWGGWYDHVAPPIRNTSPPLNSYEYGFRVPLIVISPYAKAATVSHQQNDFGSILKFIEETFSLPTTIGESVGLEYADSYALGDLSDFFNFNQTPLPFTVIPAVKDAKFFIDRKEPPTPPDND